MNLSDLIFNQKNKDILLPNQSLPIINSMFGLTRPAKSLYISLIAKYRSPIFIIIKNDDVLNIVAKELIFFNPNLVIKKYPSLNVIPFDKSRPNPKIISTRLQTLRSLSNQEKAIYLVSLPALIEKTINKTNLAEAFWEFSINKQIDRSFLIKKLHSLGYVKVDMIQEFGEYSLRGDILDIFSASYIDPIRIVFFDEQVESIKYFNLETQISSSKNQIEKITISAVSEAILSLKNIEYAKNLINEYNYQQPNDEYSNLIIDIKSGLNHPSINRLLPIYGSICSVFEYISPSMNIVLYEPQEIKIYNNQIQEDLIKEREISINQGWLTLNIDDLYSNWDEIKKKFIKSAIDLHSDNKTNKIFTINNELISYQEKGIKIKSKAERLIELISNWNDQKIPIIIAASSSTNLNRIEDILINKGIKFRIYDDQIPINEQFNNFISRDEIIISNNHLPSGFRIVDENNNHLFILLSTDEIFTNIQKPKKIRKRSIQNNLQLSMLSEGDYVVHDEYGIACYQGLIHINSNDKITDCMLLTFKDKGKLYVPVDNINLIKKYASTDGASPRLSKLGDATTWQNTKQKVSKAVSLLAKDIVALYAKRKNIKGISFPGGENELLMFEQSFPFNETEDQKIAIDDTLADLNSDKPMDRLICGDVGFGKTEVAMRAALKVIANGYQVVIVVPTTILAEQHYINFKKRFSDFPYKIEMISRFQSPPQIKKIINETKTGEVSIIIGTHRVLSADIQLRNLGLLVIDEEHRFGVRQKEKLRLKFSNIDTLTMSATPIPRSLQMSLIGIRDISLINTPPVNRLRIKTRILNFDNSVIKESVLREIRRSGQIFFIHNRVESINIVYDKLKELLPNVSIEIAHGQLDKRKLEDVMSKFIKGNFSLLLATSIIESGLDIPNANTIFINDADKLGLASLYQMRGRVGRSTTQAYAYFLVEKNKVLTIEASKRLKVLQEFTDLGSGYKIASHDLAIRGAGNFLGEAQSGNIALVGIESYLKMLDEAIENYQSPNKDKIEFTTKLTVVFDSYIPESYITSSQMRLTTYRQISACKSEDEMWNIKNNIEDRFGKIPKPVTNLLDSVVAKQWAIKLKAKSLDIGTNKITLNLTEHLKPDPKLLFSFINKNKGKIIPPNKLLFLINSPKPLQVANLLKNFYFTLLSKSK